MCNKEYDQALLEKFLNQTLIDRKKCFVSSRISEKFLRHFAKVYDDDAERITWFYLVGSIPETPFARET